MNNETYNASAILNNNIKDAHSGDLEKVLAMLVLGVGSFISGMLPALISERNARRFPLTTSIFLCFGAGILLATSLVHILPEVREQMSGNYAEIVLCAGFFFIYGVDEMVHYFFGEALQHRHNSITTHGHDHHQHQHQAASASSTNAASSSNNTRNYGTLHPTESSNLLRNHAAPDTNENANAIPDGAVPQGGQDHGDHADHEHKRHCQNEAAIEEANARICHTSHTEPCEQAMTGTLGLFAALSIHSAVEGVAIGVQNTGSKVLFLLGAVACHKFVMGFCLGLEFRSNTNTSFRSHVIGVLVFAIGAVVGIGIGMAIVDVPGSWMKSALPIVQALAGGTLLYVTNIEVIPREKARWHQNILRKSAGIIQFLAVGLGFTVMSLINNFLGEDS